MDYTNKRNALVIILLLFCSLYSMEKPEQSSAIISAPYTTQLITLNAIFMGNVQEEFDTFRKKFTTESFDYQGKMKEIYKDFELCKETLEAIRDKDVEDESGISFTPRRYTMLQEVTGACYSQFGYDTLLKALGKKQHDALKDRVWASHQKSLDNITSIHMALQLYYSSFEDIIKNYYEPDNYSLFNSLTQQHSRYNPETSTGVFDALKVVHQEKALNNDAYAWLENINFYSHDMQEHFDKDVCLLKIVFNYALGQFLSKNRLRDFARKDMTDKFINYYKTAFHKIFALHYDIITFMLTPPYER